MAATRCVHLQPIICHVGEYLRALSRVSKIGLVGMNVIKLGDMGVLHHQRHTEFVILRATPFIDRHIYVCAMSRYILGIFRYLSVEMA